MAHKSRSRQALKAPKAKATSTTPVKATSNNITIKNSATPPLQSSQIDTTKQQNAVNTSVAEGSAETNSSPKILAHLNTAQGVVGLTAAQFGQYVHDHYAAVPPFAFASSFQRYRAQQDLTARLAALQQGLDQVSLDYVAHMELLYNLLLVKDQVLFKNDQFYTAVDQQLMAHCEQLTAAGTPPFLKQVNKDWRSSYTNWYGLYDTDRALLQSLNGKAIMDVGAYIGDTLLLWRDLFPQSQLYAFEPSAYGYDYMCHMLKADIDAGRLHAYKQGVGDKAGTLNLKHTQVGAAAFSLRDDVPLPTAEQEQVEVITLDDFVAEHQLQVGLIKADVEGFEPEVVRGALNTIKTQKPVLILATYHTAEEYYELKPYLESLNLGYEFKLRRSCFSNPYSDLVLIALPKQH